MRRARGSLALLAVVTTGCDSRVDDCARAADVLRAELARSRDEALALAEDEAFLAREAGLGAPSDSAAHAMAADAGLAIEPTPAERRAAIDKARTDFEAGIEATTKKLTAHVDADFATFCAGLPDEVAACLPRYGETIRARHAATASCADDDIECAREALQRWDRANPTCAQLHAAIDGFHAAAR